MLKYIAGPLIGAIIGYLTNYIAVKMLFRPREAKYLFGHKLPFTPGAIPKGKERLARAAGNVVSNYLVTEQDIGDRFLSDAVERNVVDKVMSFMKVEIREGFVLVSENAEQYARITERIDDIITDKIIEGVRGIDVDALMKGDLKDAITQRLSGSILRAFVRSNTVESLLRSLVKEIIKYVDTNGRETIKPIVAEKMSDVRDETLLELLAHANMNEAMVREMIRGAYRSALTVVIPRVVSKMDIAGMIEKKISDMSSAELERLVLQVMDKELKLIVNLGALIGLVIGTINIFV